MRGRKVLAAVAVTIRGEKHLGVGHSEDVPDRGRQDRMERLVIRRFDHVAVGPPDLVQRHLIRLRVVGIDEVPAEETERMVPRELVPVLLEPDGRIHAAVALKEWSRNIPGQGDLVCLGEPRLLVSPGRDVKLIP